MEQIIIEIGGTINTTFPFYVEVRDENGVSLHKLMKGYVGALTFSDDLEWLLNNMGYMVIKVDEVPPL